MLQLLKSGRFCLLLPAPEKLGAYQADPQIFEVWSCVHQYPTLQYSTYNIRQEAEAFMIQPTLNPAELLCKKQQ